MRNEEGGCKPLFQGIYNVISTVEQDDLKPCPLCSSKDVIVAKNNWEHVYTWGIMCNTCKTEYKLNVATMKEAVRKWNDRKGAPREVCGNCQHFYFQEYSHDGKCDREDNFWSMDPCQDGCKDWRSKE